MVVVVLTIPPFIPTLQNEFVNWDDLFNVVDNQNYRGLGWTQLRWMFTTFHLSLYRPVTWMTLGLDYIMWGMDPAGYHLTSLVIHAANAGLFYLVTLELLRLALPAKRVSELPLRIGAGFAALFFSLHPLRVEAVAWVSARNDVVSALFVLLAVFCYLRATAAGNGSSHPIRWMAAAIMVYAVSLLAKGIGMTLPLVLLITDIYPRRRLGPAPRKWLEPEARRVLWEKVPFLTLAIAAGMLAVLAKREGQVFHGLDRYGFLIRTAESLYGLAFYLWKTVWPFGLSPLYQRPYQPVPWDWPFVASGFIVLAITVGLVILRRSWPAGLACWICYGVSLVPVLGIVQFGPQVVADRYSYLSCLSWAILTGAGVALILATKNSRQANDGNVVLVMGLGLVILVGLGFLAWKQTHVWRHSERLWRHVLAVNPATSYAYNNLAAELKRQGKLEAAIGFYRTAGELDPQYSQAFHNLGDALANRGEFEKAIKSYRKAVEIDPNALQTHHNLANTLAKHGRTEEAVGQYLKALQIAPRDAAVHNDLGNVLAAKGEMEAASQQYRKAADLDAKASAPLFNLGNIMVRQKQLQEAASYFRQALKINPDYAEAHHNLGRLLASEGKLDEAVRHFRDAVRIEPRFAAAHQSLILALTEQGKKEEALRHYQLARKFLGSQGVLGSSR